MFGNTPDSFSTYRIRTRLASNFVPPGDIIKKYGTLTTLDQKVYDAIDDKFLKAAALNELSPKYAEVFRRLVLDKTRKALIYSAFLNGSGLKMLGRILSVNGWVEFSPDDPARYKKNKTYCVWSGELGESERRIIQNRFNSKENQHGELIRAIMISPAGTEGLSLMGIRDVHLIEPHWNITRLRQVIGRALRYKSHADLPVREQSVKSYLYFSVPPLDVIADINGQLKLESNSDEKQRIVNNSRTTDESIFLSAQRKQKPIDEILDVLKSVSVDCSYYRRPTSKYDCFACTPLETNVPLNYETVEEQLVGADNCITPLQFPVKSMKRIKTKEDLELYSYKGKTYLRIPELEPPQFVEVAKR